MINLYFTILKVILIISSLLLILLVKKNKNLYEKLNKYIHFDFIVLAFAYLIGTIIKNYLKGESLLWSIFSNSVFFIIFVVIDLVVKRFWKK